MKRFKLRKGDIDVYDISKQNFERLTQGRSPYVAVGKDGQTRHFGVCPACENPIQLIGLYKKMKHTERPYGKHYNRDAFIAVHNEQAYRYCPYAVHIYNSSNKELKPDLTDFERNIYYTLRENFDLAIYLLSQISGLKVNESFASLILQEYLSSQGYMYYGATLYNIPWMLLYFLNAKPCFGKFVREGSPLYEMLKKRKDVSLIQLSDSPYYQVKGNESWLSLEFSTLFHERKVVEDEVQEEIYINLVSSGPDGLPKQEDSARLVINEYRFPNLVRSEKAKQYRNEGLLQIANKLMPDLQN